MIQHDSPSETDKQDDLTRQYANLRTGKGLVIFCPWCLKSNKPGAPPCCPFFAEGIRKIGEGQLQSIVDQRREVRLGSKRSIKCPYCGAYNREPGEHPADWIRPMVSPVCCDTFEGAMVAVAQREILQRQIDEKKRIEDGVVKQ